MVREELWLRSIVNSHLFQRQVLSWLVRLTSHLLQCKEALTFFFTFTIFLLKMVKLIVICLIFACFCSLSFCNIITCSQYTLPQLENGHYELPVRLNFTEGNRVKIHCNEGYDVVGPSEFICRENGQWSSLNSTCNINEKYFAGKLVKAIVNNVTNVSNFQTLLDQVGNDKLFVEYNGSLVVHHAIEHGRVDIVTFLMESFPNLTLAVTSDGLSPIHIASRKF